MRPPTRAVRTNDITFYELIAERGADRRLIAYCYPQSQRSMMRAIVQRRERLAPLLAVTAEQSNTVTGKGNAIVLGFESGWTIRYSGRTEREALSTGEYPYV